MDIECTFMVGQKFLRSIMVADGDEKRKAVDMSRVRSSRSATPVRVVLQAYLMLRAHWCEDMSWSKSAQRIGAAGHEESKAAM
jgi:hypothetical protein